MSSCSNCPKNNNTGITKCLFLFLFLTFHLAKFSDFAKITNDFFGKEFPAGQVKVEVKSTAKPSVGAAKTSFTDVHSHLEIIVSYS